MRFHLFSEPFLTAAPSREVEKAREEPSQASHGNSPLSRQMRIPLIVNAGSGIVNTNSADRDHAVGAKRR
jgi:hypothetical protein